MLIVASEKGTMRPSKNAYSNIGEAIIISTTREAMSPGLLAAELVTVRPATRGRYLRHRAQPD
jgi:hypothetical protein